MEKPFSDVRRKRHDASASRAGLHGRSGRRVNKSLVDTSDEKIQRTHDNSRNKHAPTYLTDLELDLGPDGKFLNSIDKDKRWETVPALLTEKALVLPQQSRAETRRSRSDKSGTTVTTYQVAPTAMVKVAKEEAPDRRLFQVRNRRPKPWATPPSAAPEEAHGARQLKVARLGGHWEGRWRTARSNLCVARNDDNACAWDVEKAGGLGRAYLDIDLGHTCKIEAFSTQGRFPYTRQYPHTWQDPLTRSFHVEDRPAWDRNERYTGPFWRRACTSEDDLFGRHHPSIVDAVQPRWVTRYELLCRAEGGRAWVSLGVFDGNKDATSEVCHSLRSIKPGVVARYLRVRPIAAVGGGALRVGVYGERVSGAAGFGRRDTILGEECAGSAADDDDAPPPFIQYTIKTPAEGAERRTFSSDKRVVMDSGRRWSRGYPREYEWSGKRARARSEAAAVNRRYKSEG